MNTADRAFLNFENEPDGELARNDRSAELEMRRKAIVMGQQLRDFLQCDCGKEMVRQIKDDAEDFAAQLVDAHPTDVEANFDLRVEARARLRVLAFFFDVEQDEAAAFKAEQLESLEAHQEPNGDEDEG